MTWLFSKQIFTCLILSLYACNVLWQWLVIKDYAWGWYWFAAFQITICAMLLSQR